jgi:hypothetical protein
MSVTRLSGGVTPADGGDPRTFPAIWNGTADDLEAGDYSKVPTGGVAGQVLTKQSATDFDADWQYLPPLSSAVTTGGTRLFGIPGQSLLVAGTQGYTGARPTADYGPFYAPFTIEISELAYQITAIGAGTADVTLEVSIYSADVDWQPTGSRSLLSTIDHSATGVTVVTGLSEVLTPGRYLTEVLQTSSDRSATMRSIGVDVAGFAAYDLAASPQNSGRRIRKTSATTGDGWADSVPADTNNGGVSHQVFYKWSLP